MNSNLPDPVVVWAELLRLMGEVVVGPSLGDLMFGTATVALPDVVDGCGHRPALIDDAGRRWLLDGSGDVA